jgi:hypothetical protein
MVVSNSQTKDLARIPLIVALYNTSMTKKEMEAADCEAGAS